MDRVSYIICSQNDHNVTTVVIQQIEGGVTFDLTSVWDPNPNTEVYTS